MSAIKPSNNIIDNLVSIRYKHDVFVKCRNEVKKFEFCVEILIK